MSENMSDELEKFECELCGANVKATGKTTQHYENQDKKEIKKLKAFRS